MTVNNLLWLFPLCLATGCGDNFDAFLHEPDAMRVDVDATLPGDATPDDGATPVNDARPDDIDAAPIDENDWRTILRNPNAPLQQRIDAAFAGIDQDACFLNEDDVSNCPLSTYTAGAAHVDPTFAQREAVLVTDILAPGVELLRYRNRTLGYYQVLNDGTIGAVSLSWNLPEVFGDIITGFASSPAIPSDALAPLLPRLQQVYGDSVPALSTHGLAVFNILADLIPKNPIVFLDINLLTFHQSIPQVVCAIGSGGGAIDVQPLREQAERFAQSLRTLFATHNIRFVNASWGYTIETVRGPWRRVCGTNAPSNEVLLTILEAYQPIFDALFNTEGVFTAHASAASAVDAHYPFDQLSPDFPNRLRIGVFQHTGTGVPAEGVTEVPSAWFPFPGAADADVWVNNACDYITGCRQQRALSLTLQYGMGRGNFPLAQSSFISPVLLGAFIHFRNQMPAEAMDDELIQYLIDTLVPECAFGLSPHCRYIDPLLHEQLDGYHGPTPIGDSLP